ncbi:MAG: hypothetical protein JKY23_06040 [Nitrospinaceae bacterium]|nr:hypothetical protein [Nitrospinaceae bacterium]
MVNVVGCCAAVVLVVTFVTLRFVMDPKHFHITIDPLTNRNSRSPKSDLAYMISAVLLLSVLCVSGVVNRNLPILGNYMRHDLGWSALDEPTGVAVLARAMRTAAEYVMDYLHNTSGYPLHPSLVPYVAVMMFAVGMISLHLVSRLIWPRRADTRKTE